MSATKQSKIFNFFQRKPSLTNGASPSISIKSSPCNGEEDIPSRRKELSACGDGSWTGNLKSRSPLTPNCSKNFSFKKKRSLEETKDGSFGDDFPDPDVVDQLCAEAEKSIQRDDIEEVQESRPPKKKRKRIVSLIFKIHSICCIFQYNILRS